MCGDSGPLTKEHVISRHVRAQLSLSSKVVRHVGGVAGPAENHLNVVLWDSVCRGCNNTWMRDTEDSVVEILGAQIADVTSKELDLNEQGLVATWAAQKALILNVYMQGSGQVDAYSPEDNRRWMAARHSPAPGTRVWLIGVDAQETQGANAKAVQFANRGVGPIAYLTTFTVGCVGFQVYGENIGASQTSGVDQVPSSLQPPPGPRVALLNVWPGSGSPVVWPPRAVLPLGELPRIATWPAALVAPR